MITIRPETIHDAAAIADVHARAFDARSDEAVITALMRQRPSFVPELSLVAELNGIAAGHALFNPCSLRINGQDVRALYLAPIGIVPRNQKQGIGGQLIEAGHRLAKERGYALSFLLGDPDYYPRFGYEPGAFGESSLLCDVAACDSLPLPLTVRAPQVADIPALMQLWHQNEGAVDFALQPDTALIDWLTPNPAMQARVYCQDEQPVGYTRGNAADVRCFLAASAEVAQGMVHLLADEADSNEEYVSLPLHTCSSVAAALPGEVTHERWDAAMVCVLSDDDAAPYRAYRQALNSGERVPGRPLWPSAFDLA